MPGSGSSVPSSPAGPSPLPVPEGPGFDIGDIAAHYAYPVEFDGTGVSIALVAVYGGFRRSDLETYFAACGHAVPDIREVLVDEASNNPISNPAGNLELGRDLQILATTAPGASITVYFTPNTEMGIVDGLSEAIISGDHSVICVTWYWTETEVDPMLASALDRILTSATLMGKVVCAPGLEVDPQTGTPSAVFPGSHPYVLGCAATPTVDYKGVRYEAAAASATPVASRLHPRADWQKGPGVPHHGTRKGGGRLLPDVSCMADDIGYQCYVNGSWGGIGGVGAAACMWAGLIARLQQAGGPTAVTVFDFYQALGPANSPDGRWNSGVGWGSPQGGKLLAALRRP